MQARHLPAIDRRYWTGIAFASIFGTNLGDLYAHESGLGLGLGLAVLLAFFLATYWAETKDRFAHEAYYWLAIIIIRTGATNIADYLAYRVRIPGLALGFGLAAIIALLAWRGAARRSRNRMAAASVALAGTGPSYWGAMLAAGVFGTVVGDICAHRFGQNPAAIGSACTCLIVILATRSRFAMSIALYWCTVAILRTAGTCLGDWFAENKILHIGLSLSTMLTGLMFAAILIVWRSTYREERAAA
jgi:uncharacterized membrane-anchored protein